MEPVGCAVIIIRAAVADQGDLASGGAAEGSVRVGYTDSELIHRIDPDGNDRLFVRAAGDNVICDVDAIQGNGVLIAARACDGAAAIPKSGRIIIRSGPGLESKELGRVAVKSRQPC